MSRKLGAVIATLIACAASQGASAGEPGAPAPVMRIGGSDKVCQLTGDVDWETGRPTAARTLANFGLDAVDLGFPVEHAGKLLLLFGDSWPPHHPGGPAGELPPDDAVGVVLRQAPPDDDGKCLELRINEKPGPAPIFAPATIVGPTPVKQGFFNVPPGASAPWAVSMDFSGPITARRPLTWSRRSRHRCGARRPTPPAPRPTAATASAGA